MFIKIYEGCKVVDGVLTPVEKEKIIGLTMRQVEQLETLFLRYGVLHEVGEE